MPRRSALSDIEQEQLCVIPNSRRDIERLYPFSEPDLSLIRQRRRAENRLGFAVQLCLLRYPGRPLTIGREVPAALVQWVAEQVQARASLWLDYAEREETRRGHQRELTAYLSMRVFHLNDQRPLVRYLVPLALQNDKGILLAEQAIHYLRQHKIVLPPLRVIDRACAQAITLANGRLYRSLTEPLNQAHRDKLNTLLSLKPDTHLTWLSWLRQSPKRSNSRHILGHIERLQHLQALGLPDGIAQRIHHNRLLKVAREGAQMTPQDLSKFTAERRYATLVSMALETTANVTDGIIRLHERIVMESFAKAKLNHQKLFHQQGKSINDKVRLFSSVGQALVASRASGSDPFEAIEALLPWEQFVKSVSDAETLSRDESFGYLHLVAKRHGVLKLYLPAFLEALVFRGVSLVQPLLDAIEVIRLTYVEPRTNLPADAPIAFVPARWQSLVITDEGLSKPCYEFCALAELKDALRRGDVWVKGSRQYRPFDDYLIPTAQFVELQKSSPSKDVKLYLDTRLSLLREQLEHVNQLATDGTLPDAMFTELGLKITPQKTKVPPEAQRIIDQISRLMPRVKITELLLEVDDWVNFSDHFVHLKSNKKADDRHLLLSVILADGINLGLTRMAEACASTTYAKLTWLQGWHIRDETYSAAIAALVDAQGKDKFAQHWGDGTTSSSDGQRFRAANKAHSTGHVNLKYGLDPGRTFYTHISDQYAPFSSRVVNVGVRDSTYVLDGLLYNESDLKIEEHYTDTAGFTDHVFALMHLLGFRFAPRIRDIKDSRLFIPGKATDYPSLEPIIGDTLKTGIIEANADQIERLVSSIESGTVTASLMLQKLASYPRQNSLAVALRELGRVERTLFILEWLQDVDLRCRVQAGLNKGEARNALARAVFFNQLGEVRDRNIQQQQHRASGLNLVTAAIIRWNTVYLQQAVEALRDQGAVVDDEMLKYLSPLGWEHINLTGDYSWPRQIKSGSGRLRPLRVKA